LGLDEHPALAGFAAGNLAGFRLFPQDIRVHVQEGGGLLQV